MPIFQVWNRYHIHTDESEDDISLEQILDVGLQKYRQLNEIQKEITDIIMNAANGIDRHEIQNTCFYINGPGGTGKTSVYTTLWHYC